MTGEPWRFRCPNGHSSVRIDSTVFQCRSCNDSYPKSELVDKLDGVAVDG